MTMEKRNVELSLDKAKEWYKKGGELKEVALQAFTEDELFKTKTIIVKDDDGSLLFSVVLNTDGNVIEIHELKNRFGHLHYKPFVPQD